MDGVPVQYYVWYDQTHLAAVYDGNRNLDKYYLWGANPNGPSMLYDAKASKFYKIFTTYLGSIRYIIDSNGDFIQSIDYNEFGMVMKDTNPGYQPLGFNSGLWDHQTALVRFGARDYDPSIGRWTTKDPIGFSGGDTNLFGYVQNDPVNWTDPSGLRPDDDGGGEFAQALGVMTSQYVQMRLENTKGNDKYYHCMANCKASSMGMEGALTATFISDLREANDRIRKGDSAEACEQDQVANRTGRDAGGKGQQCAAVCGAAFPYKRAQ